MMLKIKTLKVAVDGKSSYAKASEDKQILKGVDLEVGPGEVHVVMGPNGSGKSTLAQVIAGNPAYKVSPTSLSTPLKLRGSGKLRGASSSPITFEGKDITKLTPDKRARLGIFLGFQNPMEILGVSVFNVLRKAVSGPVDSEALSLGNLRARGQTSPTGRAKGPWPKANGEATRLRASSPRFNVSAFHQQLLEYASSLKLSSGHLGRSFNEGFSGGEKKRNEILQMLALKPKLVILDEIDSGLDVDGLRLVASAIAKFKKENPKSAIILITHYARILKYIKADFVHVMVEGRIVKSGKQKLASEIEKKGYQFLSV